MPLLAGQKVAMPPAVNISQNSMGYFCDTWKMNFQVLPSMSQVRWTQDMNFVPTNNMDYVCALIEPYNRCSSMDMMSVSSVDTVTISANSSTNSTKRGDFCPAAAPGCYQTPIYVVPQIM